MFITLCWTLLNLRVHTLRLLLRLVDVLFWVTCVCNFATMFVTMKHNGKTITSAGYRRATFRIDGQWLGDHAIKFVRWQHHVTRGEVCCSTHHLSFRWNRVAEGCEPSSWPMLIFSYSPSIRDVDRFEFSRIQ